MSDPLKNLWHPTWLVDAGHGCAVGITMDDGCYVVLAQCEAGNWRPASHIPKQAAKLIGKLVNG